MTLNADIRHLEVYLAQIIYDLGTVFRPHPGQVKVGHALFYQLKKMIFIECGRKWGKTEIILYCLYRMALTVPGGYYYIAPFAKQAREIIWASQRIQSFLPPALKSKYVLSINETEMRVKFKNGSFIKLDGSDNFEAYRGINPHGMVYEEFKDFHPEFHNASDPNRATFDAPLLIIGTPPETLNNQFCQLADYCKNNQQNESAYFNYPTWGNPGISRKFLFNKKRELFDLGDEDVWYREYEAKRFVGGKKSIFPMWSRDRLLWPHEKVMAEVSRDRKKLIWQCIADPAAATVFGVLFRAHNPYTKTTYRLGNIYERDPKGMTTASIWEKIDRIIQELNPDTKAWHFIYDEAGIWFANEMAPIFEREQIQNGWNYSNKASRDKDEGINLMRQQMLEGKFIVSDRCLYKHGEEPGGMVWEIENYIKDKNGKIPKINDHLIDCDRYGDNYIVYNTIEAKEPEPVEDTRRFHTPESDWHDYRRGTDPNYLADIFEEEYI